MRDYLKLGDGADLASAGDLPAGRFGPWLEATRRALREGAPVDVPCGDCTGCCRASLFVHVGADEDAALARIPAALLFPAPGNAAGTRLMGYDESGRCPMLGADGCSIYAHRPRACRAYDCRVLVAAGIALTDPAKAPVAERVRRWRFSYDGADDRRAHAAVRAAGAFLTDQARRFERPLPADPADRAAIAIEIYPVFLRLADELERTGRRASTDEIFAAVSACLEAAGLA